MEMMVKIRGSKFMLAEELTNCQHCFWNLALLLEILEINKNLGLKLRHSSPYWLPEPLWRQSAFPSDMEHCLTLLAEVFGVAFPIELPLFSLYPSLVSSIPAETDLVLCSFPAPAASCCKLTYSGATIWAHQYVYTSMCKQDHGN